MLAVDAGVPIVPVVISGTHEIMPKGRLLVRRQSVRVQLQPPIMTSGYTRDNKDDLMALVHQSMVRCQFPEGQEERNA